MVRSRSSLCAGFVLIVGLTAFQNITKIDEVVAADPVHKQTPALRTNMIDGAELVLVPPGEFVMGSDPQEIDRI